MVLGGNAESVGLDDNAGPRALLPSDAPDTPKESSPRNLPSDAPDTSKESSARNLPSDAPDTPKESSARNVGKEPNARLWIKGLPTEAGREKGDFLRDGFSSMLERAVGSVVTVLVTADRPLGPNLDTLSDGDLQSILESGMYPKPISQKIMCSGTGFVVKTVDAEGRKILAIVTNNHVVDPVVKGSGVIHVAFSSGETIPAKIIGVDARTDLAVLSIQPPKNIKALPWGKSKKLKVGHWALAIGAPGVGSGGGHSPAMTLDFSVTHGIVSNVKRVVPELAATHITYFIQTDASVNPGNSGGPLLNVDGEVIGINTMMFSPSGGSHGMNMAIPSDLALPVVDQLARGKPVRRGYIGIQIGDNVSLNLSKHLGMMGPRGVIVDSVLPNTAAEQGGLQDSDVILKIDNQPISNHQQARAFIAAVEPGKILSMKIWRAGKKQSVGQEGREIDLSMTVGQLPLDIASKRHEQQVLRVKEFGVSFRHIASGAMARMRMHLGSESAVIVDTVSNPASANDTVLPGDIIVRINGAPVTSLEDVRSIMNTEIQSGQRTLLFFIQRYINGHGYREMSKVLAR
jgi:serine protease Do